MLIEQAFHNLPEILCGSHYPQQDYESGLVVALTLAILQELNGRNAQNPLAYLKAEKLYRARGRFPRAVAARPLRADLHVDLRALHVGNRTLRQYSWKHFNWVEAKFFRGQTDNGERHSSNKTNHAAGIIEDLLRLAILVYERPGTTSSSARYFLHVYDASPDLYLPFRNRKWLRNLTLPGSQEVAISELNNEVATIKRIIGPITDLEVEISAFNQVIGPLYRKHFPVYTCILSRLDSFKVALDQCQFEVTPEGQVIESERGAFKTIVGYLASNIRLQDKDKVGLDTEPSFEEMGYGDITPPIDEVEFFDEDIDYNSFMQDDEESNHRPD